MREELFFQIEQLEDEFAAKAGVDECPQETHGYTSPAPDTDGHAAAHLPLQPGGIHFANIRATRLRAIRGRCFGPL